MVVQPNWDFDVQLFAQAPSAELATVGIGRETTYGTAVSPTLFLIPSSENFDGTNELLDRPGARKHIGQTEQLTGLYTRKGSCRSKPIRIRWACCCWRWVSRASSPIPRTPLRLP